MPEIYKKINTGRTIQLCVHYLHLKLQKCLKMMHHIFDYFFTIQDRPVFPQLIQHYNIFVLCISTIYGILCKAIVLTITRMNKEMLQ